MVNMKITIITATYNSASTVRDTLESVACQGYHPIEHIIVDGLSIDNTLDIVKEFPHVAQVVSEKDMGIYDAMNKGVRLATGEVVGILNSDDFYDNQGVISQVMTAFNDPLVDVVYGDLQYVKKNDVYVVTRNWKSGQYKRRYFYYGWMPPHPAFFVRRKIYDEVGLFNTDLRSAADYEMMLRILVRNNASASYIPNVLVKMRSGGMSNASLKNRLRANREDRKAWAMNDLKPFFYDLAQTHA
ncbi:glycosyltransferase family 2 protein [Paraflavitalea speifideaquila]|uniref:glycosyltransferase family 2 protein n=1 Tax=Paraflavitalea speifideaquila TaxID=3076558 RepID=UPI0028E2C6A6|nr:glycosyltransferase family 2 protein [Paraflavitalea speifideiaquila]